MASNQVNSDLDTREIGPAPAPDKSSGAWGVFADVSQASHATLNQEFIDLLTRVKSLMKSIETWLDSRDILSQQVGYLKLAKAPAGTESLNTEQVVRPEIEAMRLQKMRTQARSYGELTELPEATINGVIEGLGVISTLLMTRSKNIQFALQYRDTMTSTAVDSHRHHTEGVDNYFDEKLSELGETIESVDESLAELIVELAKGLRGYTALLSDTESRMLLGNPKTHNEELLSLIFGLAMRVRGSKGIPVGVRAW